MTYHLYVDVLFLENAMMNVLLLLFLRKILKYHTSKIRVILAACVGSLWAVFVVVWPVLPTLLEVILTYFVISFFMIKVAFGEKEGKAIIKGVLGLYLSALLFSGAISAVYQRTTIPFVALLFLGIGTYFFVSAIWQVTLSHKRQKENLYEVTLFYRGQTKKVIGLMDTGNRLFEPITKKPVHVVTYEALRHLCEQVSAVVYIPYQSVGKERGLLPGIYLDEIQIRDGNRNVVIEKPLVAISKHSLSPGGEYQMLLHQE